VTATAWANSPDPQSIQRCSVTVAQNRLQNDLRDAIYTTSPPALPQKCARTSSLPRCAPLPGAVRRPRPPFLPHASRPACACTSAPHAARRVLLLADLANLRRPVTFSCPLAGLYSLVPVNQHCAVSPRYKGFHVRDDPGLPALAAPTGPLSRSFHRHPNHQGGSGASTSALSSGAAARPRTDKKALAQSATVLVPPDVPHL
jgi:hypothetical protein